MTGIFGSVKKLYFVGVTVRKPEKYWEKGEERYVTVYFVSIYLFYFILGFVVKG